MSETQPGGVAEAVRDHEKKEVANAAEIKRQLAELGESMKVAVQQSEALGQTLARVTEQGQGSEVQRIELERLHQESQNTLQDMREHQAGLAESLETITQTLQDLEKHK